MKSVMLGCALALAACHRDRPRPPPPPPPQPQPVRGAAADDDVRAMIAEIASSRACDMIRDRFVPLHNALRPDVVSGTLWVRGCTIASHGAHLTLTISGQGWQWADRSANEAGGRFVVHQYVRFAARATVPGTLDIGYDRAAHVATIWFTPERAPDVKFEPIGEVAVDRDGLWSSLIGAVSAAVAESPEDKGKDETRAQGVGQFQQQLGRGLSVAIDLCTGYRRFQLGEPPKGKLGVPNLGESRRVPAAIEPTGMLALGPWPAPLGMTLDVHPRSGGVEIAAMCASDGNELAAAFLADQPLPQVPTLGGGVVRKDMRVRVHAARCPVIVIARPLDRREAVFDLTRPSAEQARALGGAIVDCAK